MEQQAEIKFSLVFIVSLCLHAVILSGLLMPDYKSIMHRENMKEKMFSGRDIIVNVNEDEKLVQNRQTLLSEKTSTAKGYITKEKGNRWLNNALDFRLKKGSKSRGKAVTQSKSSARDRALLINDNTEIIINLMKEVTSGVFGATGSKEFTTIPDKYDITPKNAIYYTNDGRFSFNTKKFKPFKYFKQMKDKIAANWHPPMAANAHIQGYAPGHFRIMAFPSQEIKLYFTMDRSGKVLNVVLVDSMGNKPLDESCLDAIRLSKSFGKVPEEIKGEKVVIPFIFRIITK